MSVAIVEQPTVNAYLDRIQRLIDGVNAFKQRLDEMLMESPTARMEQPEPGPHSMREPVSQPISAVYEPVPEPAAPVAQTSQAVDPEPRKVTADDVDIDAILSDISTDYDLGV